MIHAAVDQKMHEAEIEAAMELDAEEGEEEKNGDDDDEVWFFMSAS